MEHERDIYIGLDIGGTHLRLIVFNGTNKQFYPLVKTRWVSAERADLDVERNLCGLIDEALRHYHISECRVYGLGIALAANFDRKTGCITRWPNRQLWNRFPLADYLRERYPNIPCITLEDDANAAALGEYVLWRQEGGPANALYVTLGTGVGCGMILNGALYIGERGLAGEIGHAVVQPTGPFCVCGRQGCLQAMVSGPAMLRNMIIRYPPLQNAQSLTEATRMAEQNGYDIQDVFREAGGILGEFFTTLVQTLDISLIIMGGGVLDATHGILIETARQRLTSFFDDFGHKVMIARSEWEDVNGLVGALSLHCRELLSAEMLYRQKQVIYTESTVH